MSPMSVSQLFDVAVVRLLGERAGTERGRIMHSIGVRTAAGKFFAFVRDDELVLKLPAERVRELISSGAGSPFDAGKGRPMREWVRVRPADVSSCERLIAEACDFVDRPARASS